MQFIHTTEICIVISAVFSTQFHLERASAGTGPALYHQSERTMLMQRYMTRRADSSMVTLCRSVQTLLQHAQRLHFSASLATAPQIFAAAVKQQVIPLWLRTQRGSTANDVRASDFIPQNMDLPIKAHASRHDGSMCCLSEGMILLRPKSANAQHLTTDAACVHSLLTLHVIHILHPFLLEKHGKVAGFCVQIEKKWLGQACATNGVNTKYKIRVSSTEELAPVAISARHS